MLACYVVNSTGEDSAGRKKCAPLLEDYYECLHHKKEVRCSGRSADWECPAPVADLLAKNSVVCGLKLTDPAAYPRTKTPARPPESPGGHPTRLGAERRPDTEPRPAGEGERYREGTGLVIGGVCMTMGEGGDVGTATILYIGDRKAFSCSMEHIRTFWLRLRSLLTTAVMQKGMVTRSVMLTLLAL